MIGVIGYGFKVHAMAKDHYKQLIGVKLKQLVL
jgi:hypothetical protein